MQEPLRLTIPIEMHNSAGFNLTLDINGSATVVYDDEGEYISSGYLHETTTIPPRSSKIVHYYSDINEFLTRYSRESGLLSLTSHAIDKVLRSATTRRISHSKIVCRRRPGALLLMLAHSEQGSTTPRAERCRCRGVRRRTALTTGSETELHLASRAVLSSSKENWRSMRLSRQAARDLGC